MFLNLDHSVASLQYRVFVIFFVSVLPGEHMRMTRFNLLQN